MPNFARVADMVGGLRGAIADYRNNDRQAMQDKLSMVKQFMDIHSQETRGQLETAQAQKAAIEAQMLPFTTGQEMRYKKAQTDTSISQGLENTARTAQINIDVANEQRPVSDDVLATYRTLHPDHAAEFVQGLTEGQAKIVFDRINLEKQIESEKSIAKKRNEDLKEIQAQNNAYLSAAKNPSMVKVLQSGGIALTGKETAEELKLLFSSAFKTVDDMGQALMRNILIQQYTQNMGIKQTQQTDRESMISNVMSSMNIDRATASNIIDTYKNPVAVTAQIESIEKIKNAKLEDDPNANVSEENAQQAILRQVQNALVPMPTQKEKSINITDSDWYALGQNGQIQKRKEYAKRGIGEINLVQAFPEVDEKTMTIKSVYKPVITMKIDVNGATISATRYSYDEEGKFIEQQDISPKKPEKKSTQPTTKPATTQPTSALSPQNQKAVQQNTIQQERQIAKPTTTQKPTGNNPLSAPTWNDFTDRINTFNSYVRAYEYLVANKPTIFKQYGQNAAKIDKLIALIKPLADRERNINK